MTSRTGPRLPSRLFPTGFSVAVEAPYGDGAMAHRPFAMTRPFVDQRQRWRKDARETVAVPACVTKDADAEVCALLSAAWADHVGAVACTETACFPDAI